MNIDKILINAFERAELLALAHDRAIKRTDNISLLQDSKSQFKHYTKVMNYLVDRTMRVPKAKIYQFKRRA